MASPAMNPGGGPPQQGGGAQPTPPTAQATPAVAQIVSNIASLTEMLKQVFPPSAPKAQEIQKSLMDIQSLMAQTQSPAQSQAPPI